MAPDFQGRSPSLGAWCSVPGSYAAEILARAGFDWLCLDTQHGMLGFSDVITMLQAAAITQTPALVRVPPGDSAAIMKALDAGAAGAIVPLVNTAAQAREAAGACRYWPAGSRSWGPARAQLTAAAYTPTSANVAIACVVQIETAEAIANLDAILAVPGVDVALVGPSDLAVNLGLVPGTGPIEGAHEEMLRDLAPRIKSHGVTAAIYCGSAAASLTCYRLGYTMLAVTSDALLLRHGAAAALDAVRSGLTRAPS